MSVLPYDKPLLPIDRGPLKAKPVPLLTPLAYAYKQNGKWDYCCPLGFTPPEPVYSWHYETDRWLNQQAARELLASHNRPAALNTFLRQKAREARAARQAQQTQWMLTPDGIEQHLLQQPYFIRRDYQQHLTHLQQNAPAQQVMDYLVNRVKPVLLRVDRVHRQQKFMAYGELTARFHQRIARLTGLSRSDVRLLGTDIAARLEVMLNRILLRWYDKHGDDTAGFPLLPLYRHLARETLSLRVWPPGIDDEDTGTDALTGALSRLTDADWWADRLWRLRRDDREALLRAANRVHARAHPYLSREAFMEWREQRRRNRGFLQSHELEDEDGNTAPLFEQVLKSVANPALRRHELMARMEGVEQVALRRGDTGMFYTVTCPSKYHSTHHYGAPNDKWQYLTIRDGQRYLCHLWGLIGAKLKRENLRPYGFRVAEPHHDGTPHWHLLLFMPPADRRAVTRIIHAYTIREDRQELSKFHRERFNVKKIDPEKGSATAYIAKYISKNIDGYALDDEVCHESGRPLKDTARFATAWASLHRIRQYQPAGLPPVTVWRELRKLNNQLTHKLKLRGCYRRGQPLLTVRWMDNLMAAADAGCFASYIEAQGGVLIPRKHYRIRIAYQTADTPNQYGETVQKVFGIWAPALGEESRINTYPVKWKIVRRKPKNNTGAHHRAPGAVGLGFDFDVPGGNAAPWSSVNNSTGAQKITQKMPGKPRLLTLCRQLKSLKKGLGLSVPVKFLAKQLLNGGKVRLTDAEIVLDRGQVRLLTPETARKAPQSGRKKRETGNKKPQNAQQTTALLQRVARLRAQSPQWRPF